MLKPSRPETGLNVSRTTWLRYFLLRRWQWPLSTSLWVVLVSSAAAGSFSPAGDANSRLYQLHRDGSIWVWNGKGCASETCLSWSKLDQNPATTKLAAAGAALYQLHQNGEIWRYTGHPCTPQGCFGWEKLDNNPLTLDIVAADDGLFQLHKTGAVWKWRGGACTATCGSWVRVQFDGPTVQIVESMNRIFRRDSDGTISAQNSSFTTSCDRLPCGWDLLDKNPTTAIIASAASNIRRVEYTPNWKEQTFYNHQGFALYQLHSDGSLWRSIGWKCVKDSCPGWQRIDNNPMTKLIAAGADQLFQLHKNGIMWRFTGEPCLSSGACYGWRQIDKNTATVALAASASDLFQLHFNGRIYRWSGADCQGANCYGWQLLDNNPGTSAIVAASLSDKALAHVEPYATVGACTRYERNWSRFGPEDTFLGPVCLDLLGINAYCSKQHARVFVDFTADVPGVPQRRFLFCQEIKEALNVEQQINRIYKGVGRGLEDAMVASAPYLSLAATGYACTNGVIYACAVLALDVADDASGGEVSRLKVPVVAAANQAIQCVNGNVAGCASFAYQGARQLGVQIPGGDVIRLADLTQRCADGEFSACAQLGRQAGEAAGIPVGLGLSTVADAQACLAGDLTACQALGKDLSAAGVPLGGILEGTDLSLRCRNGEAAACLELGRRGAKAAGL